MGQEIYNEGRVVGLSAYEIFLKQLFSKNPMAAENPPTEPEWLASMMGMGCSLILKIPTGAQGICDYPLPPHSNLTASGTIVASAFDGDCDWTLTPPYWATKVISYGGLIKNVDAAGSPTSALVPTDEAELKSANRKYLYAEFAKVTDGIFVQQGAVNNGWVETSSGHPYKDLLSPDFNRQGVIRLYIEEPLANPINILFTGFINKTIVQGVSGINGSTDTSTNDWENGGMLGPEIFPWSSKIIFSVPNGTYYSDGTYERTMPVAEEGYAVPSQIGRYNFTPDTQGNLKESVKAHAVIDFNSIRLEDYYDVQHLDPNPVVTESISALSLGSKDSINAIAAWYPGMSTSRLAEVATLSNPEAYFFPPAIYGIKVSNTGDTKTLVPLDVAAPGTIKVFEDPQIAYNYVVQNPHNYAIYHTYDDTKHIDINYFISQDSAPYDPSQPSVIPWQAMSADMEYRTVQQNNRTIDYTKFIIGGKSYETVSLSDANGDRLPLNGNMTLDLTTKAMAWEDLLDALHNNYFIDPVGNKLRRFNVGLPNVVTEGNNYFSVGASDMATPDSGATIKHINGEAVFNKAPKSGTEYYVFNNGNGAADLRLYIAGSEPDPTDVPVGSIGIGW